MAVQQNYCKYTGTNKNGSLCSVARGKILFLTGRGLAFLFPTKPNPLCCEPLPASVLQGGLTIPISWKAAEKIF